MQLLDSTSEETLNRVREMEGRSGVQAEPGQLAQQQLWQQQRRELGQAQAGPAANVGPDEQAVSVVAGAVLGLLGLSRRTLPGLVCAGLGGMLLYRGVTGRCPVSKALGLDSAHPDGRYAEESYETGLKVTTAFTINRPAEELYRFWRNFENLPRFMQHLESVRVLDDRRSHWVARAPRFVGGKVGWDAEITRDDPNELIAWRSLPGSTVDTSGQVRFQPALGERGTEVHVWMTYIPPGGRLGHWVTSLLGENPKRVVREELRNFKRIMEVGEVLTITGQQHGTCTGRGTRYTESEWKPMFT
jgi:uncharacterized membrane protein